MTTTASIQYSHTIGFMANQGRGFNNPVDLALDSGGTLYVLNRAGPEVGIRLPYKRVTICTAAEDYLGEFGTGGTAAGDFWWPSSLAFDSDDRLYVADEALNRISIYDRNGTFLGKWGGAGTAAGQLNRPSFVAFDGQDNLLIADSLNHRIQKFDRDGRSLSAWGALGQGPGQFNMPWGVSVANDGSVNVADWRNDRIQTFAPDGEFRSQWPAPGKSPLPPFSEGGEEGRLYRPSSVAVDSQGVRYVADWGNERVQVISAEGELLASLRGESVDSRWADDYFNANPDEGSARRRADLEPRIPARPEYNREESANVEKLLWGPTAVKVDGAGRIYIVDSCRHRLQIYHRGT